MMHFSSKYYFFFVIYFLWIETICGQDYFNTVQQYTVEKGLSDNLVRDIYQDSNGFIWIATSAGMNRFDGHEFVHYTKENHGLESNNFELILEDRNGKMWFVSQGEWNVDGLAFFTKNIEIFDQLKESSVSLEDFFELTFQASDVRWFFEDHEKNIWISTKQGALYKYDGKSLEKVIQKNVKNDWLGRFAIATDGKIGLLERDEVTIFDANGSSLYSRKIPYVCVLIYAGLNGDFWIANTRSQLEDESNVRFWFLGNDRQFEPLYLKNADGSNFKIPDGENIYTSFRMDKKGRYWGFADEQFLLFEKDGRLIHNFTEILKTNDLPAESILFNFGAENFMWLSTEKGAFSIALRNNQFQKVISTSDYALDGSIIEDGQGNVLISQQNILKINADNEVINQIPIKDAMISAKDHKGNIWFLDKKFGLHHYISKTGKYRSIPKSKSTDDYYSEDLFVRRMALCMYVNHSSSNIFVGLRTGGISVMDAQSGTISPYSKYNEFYDLKKAVINHFYEKNGVIWLCTNKGLFNMTEEEGVLNHFNQSQNGVQFNDIFHIHIDSNDIVWMATRGDGLIKWDRKTRHAKKFGLQEGFSHQTVYAVYEDDNNQLWLPSSYGLIQINKSNEDVFVWYTDDGLLFNEFIHQFHFQSSDGKLFLGGAVGDVMAFYPSKLEQKTKRLAICQYLELDVKTGSQINKTEKVSSGEIIIPSDVKASILKTSLLDFTTPKNTKYSYKIDYDNEEKTVAWNSLQNNVIRLNNLPYGEHKLHVQAIGADDYRTKGVLDIPIFVVIPFYLKSWFFILVTLGLVGLIYGYSRWRTFQLLKDKKRLLQEVAKRTKQIEEQKIELLKSNNTKDRIMAIIGHDLRGPLHSLQGLDEQINYLLETGQAERLKSLGQTMEKSARFLTDTLNNLLKWAMNQMGAFPYTPEDVHLEALIENVFDLFQGNAKAKNISLRLEIQDELTAFVDSNAISTILRNLISNAIKFTAHGGVISVKGSKKDGVTKLSVSDSGIGMPDEQIKSIIDGTSIVKQRGTQGEKSSGLGLILCRDLLIQNKGVMSIEASKGNGTTFYIELPAMDKIDEQ